MEHIKPKYNYGDIVIVEDSAHELDSKLGVVVEILDEGIGQFNYGIDFGPFNDLLPASLHYLGIYPNKDGAYENLPEATGYYIYELHLALRQRADTLSADQLSILSI